MNIGFDGKRVTQNFTGLGNYSRYVLKTLARFYPQNQYSVYSPKPATGRSDLQDYPSINFRYPQNQLSASLWRSFGMVSNLKAAKTDLYHGLSNELPFGLKKAGIPSVVTIHDLIFLRYPEYYPFIDRKIYEYKFRYAAGHADKIIAISEQTKSDLINFFGIDESGIEVIYQNCDPSFLAKATEDEKNRVRTSHNLPEKFLLNVGTIENRKNALLIVKALKELKSDIKLVIIGRETPYTAQIKNYIKSNRLEERVHFLKNVPFKDLPLIYQLADIFIYPSEFEGFGIPILEALSSGVPVIGAKGSCLEEAGGAGSVYVNPWDSTELAGQINSIFYDDDRKRSMISSGYEHLKQFSDDKIAEKLINLYKKLI
ncbi:glycosyltransferase family 1 protein [Daejeonella sp. H1SJ63]|uniref:glycosyltransferase family 4 protein n=1 Tax=Daejeonella sp. H1SJ63 TaxID=3034145 RepID=UPI0023ECE531|nr:glycosyltransferase family 1 protein [Daejeonella sp. H1SJ63]